jgi:hypothetical protein
MPKDVFIALDDKYPDIIRQMLGTFTSHEFILQLARQEQKLYIEALYAYRAKRHRGKRTPFLMVHGILAQQLTKCPKLIRYAGKEKSSTDIFGQPNSCAKWEKVAKGKTS